MAIKHFIGAGALLASATFASGASAQGACDFGERNPAAPDEIMQFEFLIGNHRIEARQWTGEAFSQGYLEAEWNGYWGLDGNIIVDEWFGPQVSPDAPRNFGVNVRHYDPEEDRWSMVWQATNGIASILHAEVDEMSGNMHMWQVMPEPTSQRRIYFEVYSDTHWARIDGAVDDEGNFTPQFKLEAHEVPCEAED